jgi:hypothetical protein
MRYAYLRGVTSSRTSQILCHIRNGFARRQGDASERMNSLTSVNMVAFSHGSKLGGKRSQNSIYRLYTFLRF